MIGALTFVVATIGINIVANFVSPAYDLANVAPKHIDFARGGLIAAVAALLIMPWKLYGSPVASTTSSARSAPSSARCSASSSPTTTSSRRAA